MPVTQPDTPPERPGQMPASGWDIQAPYAPGSTSPVEAHGDADAGGRDDVGGSVAEAQANAEARYHEHESDTYEQGSRIGDTMTLPPSPLDPGVGSTGTTDPSGAYYDPPRDY
jgi:hypothetical protein